MEKTVLERMAKYLRDFFLTENPAPPRGETPGDERRVVLTAFEGGKGKRQRSWDGVERRKPRAVIGIPYSSDTAEKTVEEEEGMVMKRMAKYMFVVGVAAAVAVALSA